MDELFGLPAHPLVVHLPVVMLPLAVVGAAVMMVRPVWYRRFGWPVLGLALVGMLGAIFATSSGEELREEIGRSEGREAARAVAEHAEAGEAARTLAIVFFVALAAYVIVPRVLERRSVAARPANLSAAAATDVEPVAVNTRLRWLRPVLMLAVAAAAIGSLVTIIDAGHSGADSVWGNETEQGG